MRLLFRRTRCHSPVFDWEDVDLKALGNAILILLIISLLSIGDANAHEIAGEAKIVDGDTVYVGMNKIRLNGVDAPSVSKNVREVMRLTTAVTSRREHYVNSP